MTEPILFPTKSRSLTDRPVFLVPTTAFEDGDRRGIMARGMNRGGAHAIYHTDLPLALVVASRTLESYYSRRQYARAIGYTEYSSTAAYSSPAWWTRIPPWVLDPDPEEETS